ncbi:MAG: hypothetical protein R3D51_07915 [Hyphomicrobiaceae bacterium]
MGAESASPDLSQLEQRLCAVIEAAVKIVEEESVAVRQRGAADLDKFIERKGQALVNLDRHMKLNPQISSSGALAHHLQRLRSALEENRRYLQINIDAVSEVAELIVRAIETSRSDGTYAQPRAHRGK